MYPCFGRKKNCTDRRACVAVRLVGSLGLSDDVPASVELNVPVAKSIATALLPTSPSRESSGVLKYSYSPSVSRSTYCPLTPPSKSKTDMPTSAVGGSTNGMLIAAHE